MLINSKNLKEAMLIGLEKLRNAPIRSPRGKRTRELLNVQIEIENPRARIAKIPGRNYNLAFNIAEFLAHVSGINSTHYISHFNDKVADFSDNGVVFYGSYGERLKTNIPKLIHKLRESPDTRQAVLTIFDTRDAFENTLDTPCTIALDFKIRDGKLHLHTFMRSNDIIWGFQYDVFAFTMLQEMIANSLNCELGKYYHTATSFHIYEPYWEYTIKHLSKAESIEFSINHNYQDIIDIAQKSYRYADNYFDITPPKDELLQVLNFYNFKNQIDKDLSLLEGNKWAKQLYEDVEENDLD